MTSTDTDRALAGALKGAELGATISMAGLVTHVRHPITGTVIPMSFRIAAATTAGCVLAGVIIGWRQRRMTTTGPALASGVIAVLGGMALFRIALIGTYPLTVASVLAPLLTALVAGAIAGLLVRDVSGAADQPPTLSWTFAIAHWLAARARRPSRRTLRRREAIRRQPFPEEWMAWVRAAVASWEEMPPEHRERLLGDVQVFLCEKSFEGCGGLELTEEMRVTVAAQACLLSLNQDDLYPSLRSILIYPAAYQPRQVDWLRQVEPVRTPDARLGESWAKGTVVLAWDAVRAGIRNHGDGSNVTLHEFAHQLDQDDGAGDGIPFLREPSAMLSFATVMARDFRRHRRESRDGIASVLGEYGATSPVEFFAVATECFFERPASLAKAYPRVYRALADYYGQDPARRAGNPVPA